MLTGVLNNAQPTSITPMLPIDIFITLHVLITYACTPITDRLQINNKCITTQCVLLDYTPNSAFVRTKCVFKLT